MEVFLAQLRDRQEIMDLLTQYSLNMDLNRPADMRELFSKDCIVDFLPGKPVLHGPDEVVHHLIERLKPVKATSHHISNIRINFENAERAHGVTYLFAWHAYWDGRPNGYLWGQYHDVFVKTDQGWRIRERRLLVAGTENFDRAVMHSLPRDGDARRGLTL